MMSAPIGPVEQRDFLSVSTISSSLRLLAHGRTKREGLQWYFFKGIGHSFAFDDRQTSGGSAIVSCHWKGARDPLKARRSLSCEPDSQIQTQVCRVYSPTVSVKGA